jgi:hypothetical protein
MQFPRYELVVPPLSGPPTRPQPRPEAQPPRTVRRSRRTFMARRPELDIHQYLELEFAVDDPR